jgi:hypothetical protein
MQVEGNFQIRLTENAQPQSSGISVYEEDNYGLLVPPPQVVPPIIVHPVHLYTSLYDFSPFELGSLRIYGNKIRAVVVDVDKSPPCRNEWVSAALKHIFEYVNKIQAPALSLPLLGHAHGGLQADTCLKLIRQASLEYRDILPPLVSLHMDKQYFPLAHELFTAAGLLQKRVYSYKDGLSWRHRNTNN